MRRHLTLIPLTALALLAASCQPDTGAPWPGPCKSEWVVYEGVDVAGETWATPFVQGDVRVMRYIWDQHGRLVAMEDDDDDDGVPESRVTWTFDAHGRRATRSVDMGADGTIEATRTYEHGDYASSAPPATGIWSRCHGECDYDVHGNMLVDRDPARMDVLSYDYSCWRMEGGRAVYEGPAAP